MEVVIKIPDEMWERVKDGYVPLGISKYLMNGIPLPKGHGDLIDRQELLKTPMNTANCPKNYVKQDRKGVIK